MEPVLKIFLVISAVCVLLVTFVIILVLLQLRKAIKSIGVLLLNFNDLVGKVKENFLEILGKAKENISKVGSVIAAVEEAIKSVRTSIENIKSPFTTLLTFLGSLLALLLERFEKSKKTSGAKIKKTRSRKKK
jgi:predicted PurR-regulated permease PerM